MDGVNERKVILTIIVPCYNGEKYIGRCVDSFKGLRNDVQVIFINDGSTDSSRKLLEEYCLNNNRATLVNKENGGYCSAINAGIDRCESEYIMFLGVDDEIESEGINKIVEHLVNNSPDILAFQTIKVDDDELLDPVIDDFTSYSGEMLFIGDIYNLSLKHGMDARIMYLRDTSRCFSMSVINDLRYYGKRGVSADGCFSSLVALNAKRFEFVNEIGYIWHLHDDSISARERSQEDTWDELGVWKEFFYVINEKYKRIPTPIISYLNRYMWMVLDFGKKHDWTKAMEHVAFIREVGRFIFLKKMSCIARCKFTMRYINFWMDSIIIEMKNRNL